jgi:hypothetical protein
LPLLEELEELDDPEVLGASDDLSLPLPFSLPFPFDFASPELPDEDEDELVLGDDPSVEGAESPASLVFPGAEPELPGLSDATESTSSLGEVVVVSSVSVEPT